MSYRALRGITKIPEEVHQRKNKTRLQDDLEPENELQRVDPEDYVEYVSQDEWEEIVRQHDQYLK